MKFKDRGRVSQLARQAPIGSQLQQACTVLEHYHIDHTDDIVTRFKATGSGADIYIVQDQEWKQRIAACVEEIFAVEKPQ